MNLIVPSTGTARRVTLTALLLLLLVATALAQRSVSYYIALGSTVTSDSEWGEGHEGGFSGEIGIMRPIGPSWDLVGAFSFERFDARLERSELEYLELYDPPLAGEPVFGPLHGGKDYIYTVRGGVRRGFSTSTAIKPYVGAHLGISVADQNVAFVDRMIESPGGSESTRIVVQGDNTQFGLGVSGVIGLTATIGNFGRVFVESGYTYVQTPDDSIADNPSFFPIRMGVVF